MSKSLIIYFSRADENYAVGYRDLRKGTNGYGTRNTITWKSSTL